jgi:hypothetical protein
MSEGQPANQPATLSATDFIKLAIEKGLRPAEIRNELRKAGINWKYSYVAHCGNRARARYLRQASLCTDGCGATAPKHRTPRVCDTCLERKWAE